jgi:hypothetical protein
MHLKMQQPEPVHIEVVAWMIGISRMPLKLTSFASGPTETK